MRCGYQFFVRYGTILEGIDLSKTRITIVSNANAAAIVACWLSSLKNRVLIGQRSQVSSRMTF
jgi:hypothetical protein